MIIEADIKQKSKVGGVRERYSTAVLCPVQNKYYSETFHWIDKGKKAESYYYIGVQIYWHGWNPKLAFWQFNMNLNNA